jgi:preprotein translocase subunit SecE
VSSIASEEAMQDVIFVFAAVAFFAIAIGYVRFCERMK